MQKMIEKAAVLMEVMPYIQRFRGETVVVKFGGSIMDNEQGVKSILRDIAFMHCAGLRPVVVHGGGKAISREMKEQNLKPQFVRGLRVTDEQTIHLVEQVLNNTVNPELVAILESFGCQARGIHGDDIFTVTRKTGEDPATGETLDWGFVGEVTVVDATPVRAFLDAHLTPVVTPVGRGESDQHLYNVNADEAASALAVALKARKLVFLSDVPGLLANPNDKHSVISSVHADEVPELARRRIIDGGMLPKIDGGLKALKAGVRKTHIIDAGLPHSLLLELFTDEGVGTELIH